MKNSTNNHWLYKGLKTILSSPELIKNRVKEASLINQDNPDKISDYLIRKKIEINTAVGALTGAAGVIPVIGTIGAVAATVTVELVTVTHQEIELCLELAHNYGHDISNEKRIFEILAIIGQKRKVKKIDVINKIASRKALDSVIRRYARVGLLKALRRTAQILELRVGLRAFTKLVPVVGIILGGGINYYITRNTGLLAKEFYGTELK